MEIWGNHYRMQSIPSGFFVSRESINFETSYNSLRRSEIQKNLNAISFLLREAAAVFESTAIFAQSIFHLFALELEKHPDGVCVCGGTRSQSSSPKPDDLSGTFCCSSFYKIDTLSITKLKRHSGCILAHMEREIEKRLVGKECLNITLLLLHYPSSCKAVTYHLLLEQEQRHKKSKKKLRLLSLSLQEREKILFVFNNASLPYHHVQMWQL